MAHSSVVHSFNNHLRATRENYYLGRAKTIETTSEVSGDSIDEIFSRLKRTRLSSTDHLLINKFNNARERGLLASRRGDLMAAERAFTAARLLLDLNKLSQEGALLYQSYLEQAEAYLDYKQGNFEKARNRIYKGLEINLILEEEYDYKILIFGRIQLVHNLVRIDAGCQEFKQAIKLAFQILAYLEGTLDTLPINSLWGYERVKSQHPDHISAMFAQVTVEIALILAGKDRKFAADLLALGSTYLPINYNQVYHCHPQAYNWLLLKQAFVNNEVTTFLERASNFLLQRQDATLLLWYATLIDLVALCDELALPESELLKQEIVNDEITKKYMPKRFLSLLSLST